MNFFEQLANFFKSVKLPPAAQPAEVRPPVPQSFLPLTVTLANVGVRPSRSEQFAKPLALAMQEFGITTPARQAAFLAQVLHESGMLRYTAEIWGPTPAQQRYEGRADIGNTQTGDGYKYRGRGLMQTTGRTNYKLTGIALGVDLINAPEALERADLAARSAAWFWKSHGLNEIADEGDFTKITRRVNGALNGLREREKLWAATKKELGVE